jgi:hypothetical protein
MLANKLEVTRINKCNFSKKFNIIFRKPKRDLHMKSRKILKNGEGISPQRGRKLFLYYLKKFNL